MPLFFSQEALEAGWARTGRNPDEAMFLVHTVLDLRAYAVNMLMTDAMPWSIFRFVSDESEYALAKELARDAPTKDSAGEKEDGG